MSIVEYGIMNDIHWPYECEGYYAALEFFQSRTNLAGLFFNGDACEFETISSHAKSPKSRRFFVEEIEYCNVRLDEVDALFPDVPKVWITGNHEWRFARYLRDRAPELQGLVNTTDLLGFEHRPNWKVVPYEVDQLVRCGKAKLWLTHEPVCGGKNHAMNTAREFLVDVAYGHTHMYQVAEHRKFDHRGRAHINRAYSLGCLLDKTRHPFQYRGKKADWREGFTLVECDEATGEYSLEFISIDPETGSYFFRGEGYEK